MNGENRVDNKGEKMNDVIIELQDVKKIYKMNGVETPALRGVDLKINKGEFVAVQGNQHCYTWSVRLIDQRQERYS